MCLLCICFTNRDGIRSYEQEFENTYLALCALLCWGTNGFYVNVRERGPCGVYIFSILTACGLIVGKFTADRGYRIIDHWRDVMKRLCYKIALLILVLIASFLLLNAAFMRTNRYQIEDDYTARLCNVPNGIKICNLGNSHGRSAFDWSCFPDVHGYNFAVSGQTYYMSYNVLCQNAEKVSCGAVVLLPISYNQICGYSKYYKETISWYYKFLDKEHIPDWNIEYALKYKYFAIAGRPLSVILLGILHDAKAEETNLHYRDDKSMAQDALNRYALEKFNAFRCSYGNGEGYRANIDIVSKTIDFCFCRGFIPVLIIAPITDEFNALYDKNWSEFWPIFHRFTDELCAKYNGLVCLDYSHDEEFSGHGTMLFRDADHLNAQGSKKFTQKVIHDLAAVSTQHSVKTHKQVGHSTLEKEWD